MLFLVLDTQRADRLSCYGYSQPTSPHLDAFAQQATRFKQAIAPAQWTIPSHASMFTGCYPSEHQVLQSYSVLPQNRPTLAERLQQGGYFTAGFCNNPLVGIINNGLRRGFDSFLNYSGLITDRPNQAGRNPGLMGRYRQFFKRCLATVLNQVQDAFARSDWLLSLSFTPLMVPLWQTALSFKGNTTKSLGDAARLLIDRKIDRHTLPADQPVFAFINLMGVHMPYHPPRSYVARFAPHVLEDRSAQRYLRNFNSDVYGWLAPLAGRLDQAQKATLDGMYDAEVAHQDEQLGVFFRKLEESGVLENTLVIVCSDHGEHLGEKQFIGHSLSVYNELVRVPLIIRDPQGRLAPGTVVEETVSTRRLFHTMLTAAQLAQPAEAVLSLAPVIPAPVTLAPVTSVPGAAAMVTPARSANGVDSATAALDRRPSAQSGLPPLSAQASPIAESVSDRPANP
ncbi:MAG: sulfatase-like hydrolase/transferase, partial [Prochlorothrix sp.]